MSGDTYPAPEHAWTCFHCGETFTRHQVNAARDHFGIDPECMPACLFDGEHVQAELRLFRATSGRLRPVLAKLYSFREQLDSDSVTGMNADTLYNLCQAAIEAIDGVPVPEWELAGKPAPWLSDKGNAA